MAARARRNNLLRLEGEASAELARLVRGDFWFIFIFYQPWPGQDKVEGRRKKDENCTRMNFVILLRLRTARQ
jgi:hypothetical protein